ncbi:MAG: aspartate dehydrogenase [Lachnospiraceae bacterium]|nr:aspartate dehydrogenase [Lachnospiraceae bacterium]MDO5550431.1 aspartate dehydrogenase [Lachnospiraceae bacterium]
MFGRKKNKPLSTYDKTGKIPVIRASICTGEKVAGFKELESGKFDDLMLIRNDGDLKEFLRLYDVKEEDIKREW